MTLYIAAVNHFDPLGRHSLRKWLQGLAVLHDGGPGFVAVEYDPDQFAELVRQRALFRQLARAQWPDAPRQLLDALESAMAYEGDAHVDIFPDSPVVWLDEGRENDESRRITMYGEDRVRRLDAYVRNTRTPDDARRILVLLSCTAWANARAPSTGNERDQRFAALISQASDEGQGEWAIVIVGGNHASDGPGYMRRLLEDVGVTCQVSVLRPCLPQARAFGEGSNHEGGE